MHDSIYFLSLIPLLPLFSAIVIRLFGRTLMSRTAVHVLACLAPILSFILTVIAFFALKGITGPHKVLSHVLYNWIELGTSAEHFVVAMGFRFDTLSAVMTLVVTGVGSLIHLYSTGYMNTEKDYHRYFAYLNLFMAMMLILVLADSLLLMFVGWEGVGFCSYLLIGFWFQDHSNADAGKKAFIVNRIGDFGFIVGVMALWWALGLEANVWSLDYDALRNNIPALEAATVFGFPVITFATLCLFVGAIGKSAQIPLYVWLPDAMAGPTPVSALIHAATMVTAGIYMIARLSFLFDLAPFTLHVVATVGALTALFAATIGLVQNDIKKVLAYSTVSQLGYMFLACGVGAYAAGIFHLMTHAFFKALLFLGAGSVIHAMHHEQDMRKMGGLRVKLPKTFWTFTIATLAIAGIPGFSGFFSKDEILWQVWSGPYGNKFLWLVGVIAAGLTAFYMFRLWFMTFFGQCRADEKTKSHIHESPWTMTVPLMILAVFSVIGGYLWFPGFAHSWLHLPQSFPHWLETSVVVHPHEAGHESMEFLLATVSVVTAMLGIGLAYHFYYKHPEKPAGFAQAFSRIHQLLLNKYWVDEFYDRTVIRFSLLLSKWFFWFDSKIVDGVVNASGHVVIIAVRICGLFDKHVVDFLVNFTGNVTMGLGSRVRRMQTGQIQTYLGALAGVIVVLSFVWLSFLTT